MAASPTLPADVNPANTDRWTPSSTENEPKAGGSCLEICQRQGDEEGDCEDTCLQQAKMETRGFTQLACR